MIDPKHHSVSSNGSTFIPLNDYSQRSGQVMATDRNPWSLKGQTALVTGGTKGIGRAVAEELAKLGVRVWVCARGAADLQRCLDEWSSAKWEGSIHGCVCDVSISQERERLVALAAQHFSGSLAIFVSNVGVVDISFLHSEKSVFQEVMVTNVESTLHLTQLVHPLMIANGKGSIIFNSSVAGSHSMGLSFSTKVYSASKGALNQLAKDLAFEWAKDNIRVNSLATGVTLTESFKTKFPVDVIHKIEERIPLRRLADPEEIAYVMAFLCMPSSRYITGTVITVDGGLSSHVSPFSCKPIMEGTP